MDLGHLVVAVGPFGHGSGACLMVFAQPCTAEEVRSLCHGLSWSSEGEGCCFLCMLLFCECCFFFNVSFWGPNMGPVSGRGVVMWLGLDGSHSSFSHDSISAQKPFGLKNSSGVHQVYWIWMRRRRLLLYESCTRKSVSTNVFRVSTSTRQNTGVVRADCWNSASKTTPAADGPTPGSLARMNSAMDPSLPASARRACVGGGPHGTPAGDGVSQQHLFSVLVHPPPNHAGYPKGSLFHGKIIRSRVATDWGDHSLVEVRWCLLTHQSTSISLAQQCCERGGGEGVFGC